MATVEKGVASGIVLIVSGLYICVWGRSQRYEGECWGLMKDEPLYVNRFEDIEQYSEKGYSDPLVMTQSKSGAVVPNSISVITNVGPPFAFRIRCSDGIVETIGVATRESKVSL